MLGLMRGSQLCSAGKYIYKVAPPSEWFIPRQVEVFNKSRSTVLFCFVWAISVSRFLFINHVLFIFKLVRGSSRVGYANYVLCERV